MHSSRTWFWVIALTLGLGILGAVALDINIPLPWGKREPPKQDERNVPRQPQEEFRRTGIERPEPVEKGETVIVSPDKSEKGETGNEKRSPAQTPPPRAEGAGSNENQPMTRPNIHGVRLNDEAIDELRLWAKEAGISQRSIDSSNPALLIRMIKLKTQRTSGDNDKPAYHNEIMRIARMVGIPDKQVNSLGTTALLSEICIVLDNTTKFNKELLNSEDLRILAICLSDDKKLLDIVKKYHAFLNEINGRKLIILPETSNK
jgi:hypothetical protein